MSWFLKEIIEGITMVRILNTRFKRFENFWPIPKGTSYNFYVINGSEGVALIDGLMKGFHLIFGKALRK